MKKVTVDGKTVNKRTADMLKVAQWRARDDWYVVQGSYNKGVGASAGTHDGGGALDLDTDGIDVDDAVLCLREVGFAAWFRPRLVRNGDVVWNDHIHAIALDDPEAAPLAKSQMSDYRNRRNGLADHGPDTGPHLDPIPTWPLKFKYINAESVTKQFKADKPRATASVRRVQRVLNRRLDIDLKVDGVAGKQTREAWRKWQKLVGSDTVDGIAREAGLRDIARGFYRVRKS